MEGARAIPGTREHDEQPIDIAARLEEWQKAGDERLWKLIISPEFGDLTDLRGPGYGSRMGCGRTPQYRTSSCPRGGPRP
jgi:hypothetical protein